ncbi:MAG: hypothetical protein V1838_02745 [Patescibacteria group bacterium]
MLEDILEIANERNPDSQKIDSVLGVVEKYHRSNNEEIAERLPE